MGCTQKPEHYTGLRRTCVIGCTQKLPMSAQQNVLTSEINQNINRGKLHKACPTNTHSATTVIYDTQKSNTHQSCFPNTVYCRPPNTTVATVSIHPNNTTPPPPTTAPANAALLRPHSPRRCGRLCTCVGVDEFHLGCMGVRMSVPGKRRLALKGAR